MQASLSQRLRDAAAAISADRVSLGHLADVHGPAAPGTWLVLLAAPCMLPVPGVGTVLGLGLLALAAALWRGQLAARVATWQLPAPWARRVLHLLAHFYGLAGQLARQRLVAVVAAERQGWLAAQAGVMAVLIVLPIPLGNLLPALSVMLLGLGLVFRDGLAVLLSAGLAGAALLYCIALGVAVWLCGVTPLLRWMGL